MNAFQNVLQKLDLHQQEQCLNTRNVNKCFNLYPVHETSATKECTVDFSAKKIQQVSLKFESRPSSAKQIASSKQSSVDIKEIHLRKELTDSSKKESEKKSTLNDKDLHSSANNSTRKQIYQIASGKKI